MPADAPVGARVVGACAACRAFIPALRDAAADRYPHDGDGAALHADLDLCRARFSSRSEHAALRPACDAIARGFGLDLVETLVAAAPDTLCAAVAECKQHSAAAATASAAAGAGDVLISAEDRGSIMANLLAGAVGGDGAADEADDEGENQQQQQQQQQLRQRQRHAVMQRQRQVAASRLINTDHAWVRKHCTGGQSDSACPGPQAITEIMAQGMEALQERQMEEMQQQQQQMMTLNVLRMRMLSVMQSNRAIKRSVAKAERHMPGHCPCCHGCVAPAMQFTGF
jgi:hypothetical protein